MAESKCGIERFKTKGVERMMMRRGKLILSLLISGLWLVGSLGSFGEQSTGSVADRLGKSLSAAGHNHDISASAGSFDQAIRRAVRRPTIQPGSERLLTPAVIAQAQVHLVDLPFYGLDCSHDTLGLAQSWQFQWRAALLPRAPSRIS